jgi:cytochrome c oxidase subunit 2
VKYIFPCLFLTSIPSYAEGMRYNLPQGVTEISQQVYTLHMTIFFICCAIGVIVFSLMFYSMYKHRQSKGSIPQQFDENIKLEVAWTVVPFLILIVMAIPATKTLMAMEDTSASDLTIRVTGSQWKWHYHYFDHDVSFYSLLSTSQDEIYGRQDKSENYLREVDKPLVLPTNRKVRFLFTSDDVIHSWWVPDFAIKKDTIPGFINEAWTVIDKPGIYRGQCTELCGKDHGFMPIVVHALAEDEFDNWLLDAQEEARLAKSDAEKGAQEVVSYEELMTLGEQLYLTRCSACHQADGAGLAGIFPALDGSAMVKEDIPGHIDIVVNGRPGTAMAAFGQQLTPKEIAAIVTYERNAWSNKTGDVVQPAEVAAYKN